MKITLTIEATDLESNERAKLTRSERHRPRTALSCTHPTETPTMTLQPITFEYLTDLTLRAWRFAQHEWPQLPEDAIPVFELKTKDDMKNLGIGYKMAEMKALAHDEVIFRVIHEVAVQATILRLDDPKKKDMEKTLDILLSRINAANAAEADQATKH